MTKFTSVEGSMELYKKAKSYFLEKNFCECVIEISDKPIDEWVAHQTPNADLMALKRCELSCAKTSFIAIYFTDLLVQRFFFSDENMIQLEEVETGEIIAFHDITADHINRNLLLKEIGQLKKILQGA